jgi:PAS domain S-box-containing protein
MNVSLIVAALLLVALSVIGGLLARNFVREEAQRDLRVWQVRLGIVADSRFAAVDSWLNRQFDELTGLAENASLQIYMTELAAAGDDQSKRDVVEAQTDYLRNLLEATAVRVGFATGQAGGGFAANTQRTGTAGLALLDANGQIVVATETMPPLSGPLRDFVGGLKPAQRNLLDLHLNAAGRPTMAFSVPVFAVQGDRDAASQIGVVIGIKEVGDELYPLLHQPGETNETASAVLVRRQGTAIEYLSPLPDGTPPLTLKIAANTPDLDAAFAIDKPGGFEEHRDYRNRAVLVTSRSFTTAPWTLMQSITSSEALGDSKARLQRLWAALILGMALLAVALLAVWRHGTSQRATEAAVRYRTLAGQFEDQRNLLRLVTDSQPTGIVILDAEGRYRFANREAAQTAGIPVEDMSGKPIANVLGPEAAKRYLTLNRQALDSGKVVSDVMRLEGDGRLRVLQSDHIPVSLKKDAPPSVLVVERDITEAVTERERRSRILGQIVRTLVGVVDRRDPYAADHSQRVAVLARAIATEMGLPEREIETAETAGNLLNLGKILVAPELLTKSGELSDEDRRKVRHSIQTSADLLQGIEFDGPVVETLRQAQAHWDGSGSPAGLVGDDILVTARIVGVANAFVGMVSRRAYREALDIDRALEVLLSQVGKAFDRRVVAALINYLDNRGGRAHWAERARQPVRA